MSTSCLTTPLAGRRPLLGFTTPLTALMSVNGERVWTVVLVPQELFGQFSFALVLFVDLSGVLIFFYSVSK